MLGKTVLDVSAMIAYARTWAFSRNPVYAAFDSLGGDCTNFISQCLYAGGAKMNFTKDTGWYYRSLNDRAAAWTGVSFLYQFLTTNTGVGPAATQVPLYAVEKGDIIQLGNAERFYHSLLVVDVRGTEPFLAAHSRDVFNVPLRSYSYERLRVLRVTANRLNG